jgi:hypothetical protein
MPSDASAKQRHVDNTVPGTFVGVAEIVTIGELQYRIYMARAEGRDTYQKLGDFKNNF